jgi:tRNA(Arg) A34 adenosine deaminase TadA
MSADATYMRLAIEKTRAGIEAGQSPFGACIVRDGAVIACEHNLVWATTDITAHAEIVALRTACHVIEGIDLSGATIYSTTEPCPMCFAACHWARVKRIIYGAGIDDARAAGFNELTVSNSRLKSLGGSAVEIVPGFMRDECRALFDLWLERRKGAAY